MNEIKIYFISGSELSTMVTAEEVKKIKEELSYKPASIEFDLGNRVVIIPTTSIERIEISK